MNHCEGYAKHISTVDLKVIKMLPDSKICFFELFGLCETHNNHRLGPGVNRWPSNRPSKLEVGSKLLIPHCLRDDKHISTVDLKVIEMSADPKNRFFEFSAVLEKLNNLSIGSWQNSMTFKLTAEVGQPNEITVTKIEKIWHFSKKRP